MHIENESNLPYFNYLTSSDLAIIFQHRLNKCFSGECKLGFNFDE